MEDYINSHITASVDIPDAEVNVSCPLNILKLAVPRMVSKFGCDLPPAQLEKCTLVGYELHFTISFLQRLIVAYLF